MEKRNFTDIDNYVMSQILGVSISDIKRDNIFKDIIKVNGFNYFDSLDISLLTLPKSGTYNKNLLEFVNNIILNEDLDLDIDEIDDWTDEDFNLFSIYTHKSHWNYRIKLFEEGILNIKEKYKKIPEPIDWGYSKPVNQFLNSIPISLANKAYNILLKTDPYEINSLIYIEQGNDITSIENHLESICTPGTLLNNLFHLKEEGSGKGEVLVAFLYPSKINGIGDSFDILMDIGFKDEAKSSDGQSFRFGTKASSGNYKFYSNIIETRNVLETLINQLGDKFKDLVSNELYELSMQFIKRGDFKSERALSSAIDSGEINSERLHLITLWFYLAHSETYEFDPSLNPIDQDIFFKDYHTRYGLVGNTDDLINVLYSLEYVRQPWKFKEDIKKEIKKCFIGIDHLIVFNIIKYKEINIYTSSDDIVLESISQNSIKVIEKKYKRKNDTSIEDTFNIWKENKSVNFYDLYVNYLIEPFVN